MLFISLVAVVRSILITWILGKKTKSKQKTVNY